MSARVWEMAKNITLNLEGGYQCQPSDKGNWTSGKIGVGELKGTKYGICAMSYPDLDIASLTKEQAEYLYKKDYWGKCKCDYIPDALSIALFDYAFNSGVRRAVKDLQTALGVKADGVIGNQTIGACNRLPLRQIVDKYLQLRLNFVISLHNKKYEKGWVNRINRIRTICEELI